jgi:SAM-dependent methyltransferase
MNASDREAYRERYVRRLREYGYDPRSLGWAAGKQAERFQVLTSFVPLDGVTSVLDVGCGFGDLHGFLRGRGFRGRYCGVDFVPELVEEGRKVFPGIDLRAGDFSEVLEGERFDLVVASGIFNARLLHEDNWASVSTTLRRMFSACNVAAAADFLTSYVDFTRDDLSYTSPEAVFGLAKDLSRRVALRHDYMPFEFAVCLYRDDRLAEGARFFPLPGDQGVTESSGPLGVP